jgi:hypothetical protein
VIFISGARKQETNFGGIKVRINMSRDDELELNRVIREAMLVIQRAQQLISEGFDPQEAVKTACREAKGE